MNKHSGGKVSTGLSVASKKNPKGKKPATSKSGGGKPSRKMW